MDNFCMAAVHLSRLVLPASNNYKTRSIHISNSATQAISFFPICLKVTARYSEGSVNPKVRYSEGALFRRFVIPNVRYSDGSLIRR